MDRSVACVNAAHGLHRHVYGMPHPEGVSRETFDGIVFELFAQRSVVAFLAQRAAALVAGGRIQYVWRPNGGQDGTRAVYGCAVSLICETYAASTTRRKRELANKMYGDDPTAGIIATMTAARDQVAAETKSLIDRRVAARSQLARRLHTSSAPTAAGPSGS